MARITTNGLRILVDNVRILDNYANEVRVTVETEIQSKFHIVVLTRPLSLDTFA